MVANLLSQLDTQLRGLKEVEQRERGKQETILKQQRQLTEQKEALQGKQEEFLFKKELLDEASTTAREQAKTLFEEVVTNSIQIVFDKDAKAVVKLGRKNNMPTAEVAIQVEQDGVIVETDPTDEDGGGLADMVSLAIFMATSLLGSKKNVAPFFLDEPTKFVSAGNAENCANFISEMVEYTERQTFLSTHEREYLPFVADRSFLVVKENGTSTASVYAENGNTVN